MASSCAMITHSGKIYLAAIILMENLTGMEPDAMAQNKVAPLYGIILNPGLSSHYMSLVVRTNPINSLLSTQTVPLLLNT